MPTEGRARACLASRCLMEQVGVSRENVDSARCWRRFLPYLMARMGSRRSPSAYGAFTLNRTGVWACGKGRFLPNIPRSLPGTLSCFNDSRSNLVRLGDPSPKSYRHFKQWRQERWMLRPCIIHRVTTDSSATDLTLLLPYTVAGAEGFSSVPAEPARYDRSCLCSVNSEPRSDVQILVTPV